MEVRDLLVTPLLLIVLYALAYIIRPYVTDEINRKYFIPGLTIRIIGALAVGFIYQFYYDGGDTYNYHTHGSRLVWEAFWESPEKGLKLLFADGSNHEGIYRYSSRILFFTDFSSYNIIRIASVFDLLTFSSYSATAVLFGVFSFVGMWMFYLTFYKRYPHLHAPLAFAALFIPSVFFWGSGLLKDTITISCLGVATYMTARIFIEKRFNVIHVAVFALALYLLYSIKLYILLNFLPAAILWIFTSSLSAIRSPVIKIVLFPLVVAVAVSIAYFAVIKASEDNPKYSINRLAETARITAYDIRYYTGKDAGSGYSLGELDGTYNSMLMLAPEAINVSLFRPYLWEVKNPLMLLSALESFSIFMLVVLLFSRRGLSVFKHLGHPDVLFGLLFSISFAFAVGVSTFNFGTLVRYKIPLLPFFAVALILLYDLSKSERNVELLEDTA
jgi:hypothetical protein